MHKFGTFFLSALAVCALWHGSLAEDYMCILGDSDTNTCEADNETKAKLQRLEMKIEEVQTNFQAVQTKVQESQNNLEKRLLEVQTNLETQLQEILNEGENQLQAVPNEMEAPCFDKNTSTIPPGFERIGTRYFQIVNIYVSWNSARLVCRQLGGHLASFRNAEEFSAIKKRISSRRKYWLGITYDHSKEYFVSEASKKPPQFLKWKKGEPVDRNECARLYKGEISGGNCGTFSYFICQADNET